VRWRGRKKRKEGKRVKERAALMSKASLTSYFRTTMSMAQVEREGRERKGNEGGTGLRGEWAHTNILPGEQVGMT